MDTTGAGDTFTGWFCAGRMRGLSLEDAAREAVGALMRRDLKSEH